MLRRFGTAALAGRIPGLKRVPILKVLAIGEIALLARSHLRRLEPVERRRFVELLRDGRGRPRNLSEEERTELSALVAKAEPRLFAGSVADALSPVPLPKRLVRGRARR
jgi:hypothetical protein